MNKKVLLGISLVMILLSIGMASALSFNATEGLVSCWNFDSGANDYFSLNNGSVNGATLNNTEYKLGSGSYYFDGNDFISVADSSSLDILENITMQGWVRINNNNAGDEQRFINKPLNHRFGTVKNTNGGFKRIDDIYKENDKKQKSIFF